MDDEGIEELEQAAMEPEDVPGDEETHAYTPPATLDAEVLRILEDLPRSRVQGGITISRRRMWSVFLHR